MQKITVYTARCIHTMDPGRPTASAIAVSEGRIVSVGSLTSKIVPVPSSAFSGEVRRPRYSVLENGKVDELGLERMPNWQRSMHEFLAVMRARKGREARDSQQIRRAGDRLEVTTKSNPPDVLDA